MRRESEPESSYITEMPSTFFTSHNKIDTIMIGKWEMCGLRVLWMGGKKEPRESA